MSANKSRHVAIERRASRSADFALREFEFRIVQQWRTRGNAERGTCGFVSIGLEELSPLSYPDGAIEEASSHKPVDSEERKTKPCPQIFDQGG
jgi:hypothetical protein